MRKKQLALLCGFSRYDSLKRHIRNNKKLQAYLNNDPDNCIFGTNAHSRTVGRREYKILKAYFEQREYELELMGKKWSKC